MCQNSIQDKAGTSLIQFHLLLVSPVFLDPAPISFATRSSKSSQSESLPSCLLFPFYSTSPILPCFNSWCWSPLVEGEPWDAGALCYSLFLLHPCPAPVFSVWAMPSKYLSSGDNSNPNIRLAGNSFLKHCTREKLILEHHECPWKGFIILLVFTFQGYYRLKYIIVVHYIVHYIVHYRLFHLLDVIESIVNVETFRIKFHFKGEHFYPFLKIPNIIYT